MRGMYRLLKAIMLCLGIIVVCSCKKDYQKLATEFERALPDTDVVVIEQINDVDHYVYYKNKGNNYLTRHNLDDQTEETIKPKMDSTQYVNGIYLGKNNIAFIVQDETSQDEEYSWSNLYFYNLKTFKFSSVDGDFYNTFVDESKKTITGYMDFAMGRSTIKYVYSFDGKEISEEEVGPAKDDGKPKNWQCSYCGAIITSTSKPNDASCPARPVEDLFGGVYLPHVWQCLGVAE